MAAAEAGVSQAHSSGDRPRAVETGDKDTNLVTTISLLILHIIICLINMYLYYSLFIYVAVIKDISIS